MTQSNRRLCTTIMACIAALAMWAAVGGHSRRAAKGPVRQTAAEVAPKMAPGWNLGHTLEVPEGETAAQPVKTTQALIDFVKSQGFRSVRIPCAWSAHTDKNGKIDPRWMARVRQVVSYCLRSGLFVVLNDHSDNYWMETLGFSRSATEYLPVDEECAVVAQNRLRNIWRQVAAAFRNYDEHLLFAGMNEPFSDTLLFAGRHADLTPLLMRYNQVFVDAVRSTKGNNALRMLIVQAPAASMTSATAPACAFAMPADPAGAGRLMVEVHCNVPSLMVSCDGHEVPSSSAPADTGYVPQLAALKEKFADNGIPVVIGEYGAPWLLLPACQAAYDNALRAWYHGFTRQAVSHGCIPMAWDAHCIDRSSGSGQPTIIDRAALSVFCLPAMQGITEGMAASTWPYGQ